MRWLLGALFSVTVVGCFAKLAPEPGAPDGGGPLAHGDLDGGVDAALVDGSFPDASQIDASQLDANVELPDGAQAAPVPVCNGDNSECIQQGTGWIGAAEITCSGVYFVGSWTLLLERQNNGQFELVQTQTTETPGFGVTFYDTTAPLIELTYRVCVQDAAGTRCAAPFTTQGPVNCACETRSCASANVCDTQIYNGCSGYVTCGACANGTPCNPDTLSCCPAGQEASLEGNCQCAPPYPCKGGTWDPTYCQCFANTP